MPARPARDRHFWRGLLRGERRSGGAGQVRDVCAEGEKWRSRNTEGACRLPLAAGGSEYLPSGGLPSPLSPLPPECAILIFIMADLKSVTGVAPGSCKTFCRALPNLPQQ
ncbi:hypothetical protein [Kamptonema formosum]|uniref:hypothetical protein n=1 Tax=Kamptonema formosum TaxID=331992 RepID=UPI000347B650|nr:hypothetical protein [Oscillatoria sp. PCC 10802]